MTRTDLDITAAQPSTLALTSRTCIVAPGNYTLRLDAVRGDRYEEDRITNWRIVLLGDEGRKIEYIAEFPEDVSHTLAERLLLDLACIVESGGHTDSIDY